MIDQKTVRQIAALSRLHLEDAEAVRLGKDLEGIVAYIEALKALDVSDVKPTSHVLDVENVFRDDVPRPSLTNGEALSFSVESHQGFYKVPKVIE